MIAAPAIRDGRPGDHEAIRSLTTDAFRNAPHSSGTEAAIIDTLRAASALTISLVAESATDGIIGHVAFSPVTIDGVLGNWHSLGPVAVRPDRQNAGIGAALIAAGLDRLRAMAADGCVVLGDPAYYVRFGFAADSAITYRDVPPEYFQQIVFRNPAPAGNVGYHSAFEVA